MFELETAIAQWRQQMLAAGIKYPVPLEELESHLRDDVDRQVRSGQDVPEAFAAAVARMGQATALKVEFKKTERADLIGLNRLEAVGGALAVDIASAIPPGITTLRRYASIPYLAAVLCFYLPFFGVSHFFEPFSIVTGQQLAYGGKFNVFDAFNGAVELRHQNPSILAISTLVLACGALLLSLFRRPITRELSGLLGLGGAAALWMLKASLDLGAATTFFGAWHLQMRAGFWLATLCLVPGAALQLKLVKWERVAINQEPACPKPSRRRIFAELLACPSLVLLILGLWLFLPLDESPPDVSDLVVTRLKLPHDQNAYALILQAAGLVKTDFAKADSKQLGDLAMGKNWDPAFARQVLDGTERTWLLWAQAARTPQGQGPLTLLHPTPLRNLSTLAQIRAWDLARNDQPDAAMEFLFTSLQVGQRLEQGRGGRISYSMADGIRGRTLNSLRGIATEFKPSSALIRQALHQVEGDRPDQEAFANVLRGDNYSHGLDSLEDQDLDEDQRLVSEIFSHVPLVFRPNETLRISAEATRTAITGIDLPPGYPGDLRNADNFRKILRDQHGNLVGVKLLETQIGLGDGYELDTRLRAQSTVSANEAFLALVLYHREHGELPATLDALVPDYLPAVPRDYCDGQPIRYSRDFRAVWSVGTDAFTVTAAQMDLKPDRQDIYLPLDFAAPAADPNPAPVSPP